MVEIKKIYVFLEDFFDKSKGTLPNNVNNLSRKDEIINYLLSNKEDYLIIDDDSQLNNLPTNIKEKLILTSPLIGLTKSLL